MLIFQCGSRNMWGDHIHIKYLENRPRNNQLRSSSKAVFANFEIYRIWSQEQY